MIEQAGKVVGLIVVGILAVIMVVYWGLFFVLPAIILTAFFSSIIAGVFWALTLQYFDFQTLWLISTILLFIAFHVTSEHVESIKNKIDDILYEEYYEDEDDRK